MFSATHTKNPIRKKERQIGIQSGRPATVNSALVRQKAIKTAKNSGQRKSQM